MGRHKGEPHLMRRPGRAGWYGYIRRGKIISLGTDDEVAALAVLRDEVRRDADRPRGRPPSRRPKWNTVRQRAKRKQVRAGAACEACGWVGPIPDAALLNAHHIIPLGCSGPDTEENIIMLCPNHHAVTHKAWPATKGGYLGPSDRRSLVGALRALDLGVIPPTVCAKSKAGKID